MQQVIHHYGGVQSVVQLNTDGSLTTGTVQDCTAIAEHAKARHNEGYTGSGDMRLAASVPMVMIEKYCNDNGVTYAEFARSQEHKKRLLNDPALSHFRIWKGAI